MHCFVVVKLIFRKLEEPLIYLRVSVCKFALSLYVIFKRKFGHTQGRSCYFGKVNQPDVHNVHVFYSLTFLKKFRS